ncbi:Type II secretion system protein GspH [Deinococcus saxicola]
MRGQAGFTLLELLVVIAILGIIAGAFSLYLIRSLRQSELRDAAYQLVGDLRRARTGAQKSGVVNQVKVATDSSDYTVKVGINAPVTLTLPHRVKVTEQSGGVALDYQPPFGTLAATGASWKLTSPSNANLNLWVKAIGITGKVMLSATEN